ncbi:cobalamin biosynthesis protein CobD [Ramlibacter sp. G-1-2-2]|uniref:Cobalamin biosynthesis protein CobD n=1 Tax=Ramlibacter agri TaxID=2728837 RepID=A0A848H7H2_9BURK|nr:adenosylcobinamide-phosphate synthase CbiB [Ramlibacter agri]NML45310.1 cobalamin biosynthesis protein CobD [Ramlibacter agri]
MGAWLVLAALLLAFALDHVFGEPRARWHPVVGMGRYLELAGRRVAPRAGEAATATARVFTLGALAWLLGALLVVALAWSLQHALLLLPAWATALLAGIALKPLLAWRMLREETAAVEQALSVSLAAGRERLARLVSRDVNALDEAGVRESAIESLAENLNDSVVAPVFWFLLLGLPGATLYRFANTADAMWGYRGPRGGRDWEWAGKFAARADDALSWLPARLTALLIALAHHGLPWRPLRAEAARTASPNSGWPMAAMALALDVRLGKPGVYVLNAGARCAQPADGARAQVLAARAVGWLLALSVLVLLVEGA